MKKKIVLLLIVVVLGFLVFQQSKKTTEKSSEKTKGELSLQLHLDKNSAKEDSDKDGLTNKEETQLSTNYLSTDTDLDSLSDYEEVKEYHTDPLKEDTDEDGLTDYNEVKLGLDPLKKDTDGNGVLDSEEKREYTFTEMGVTLTVNGSGNIADTYVNVESDTLYSKLDGALNREYHFYSKGKVDSITASFSYTDEELESIYADIETLEVYQVNKGDFNNFKVLPKTEDPANHAVIVRIGSIEDNFYVLGDGKQLYYNGGGTKYDSNNSDLILLADSGFDVKKNGFSFKNYTSNYAAEGHCFGMSIFTNLYYQKKLPLKSKGKEIGFRTNHTLEGAFTTLAASLGLKSDFPNSHDYDLTKTALNNYNSSLYDYKLSYNISSKINEDKLQKENSNDKQVLNAIYQMHTMQAILPMIESDGLGADDIVNCADYASQTRICYFDGREALKWLESDLKAKEAVVFNYIPSGAHAVNAIRLYRYRKDENKYMLVYYNNNNPGVEETMTITCSKRSCRTDDNHGNTRISVLRSTQDVLDAFNGQTYF